MNLSAEDAARMARLALMSPPPLGYLESLPMRVLERFERERRVRRRRYIGVGLSAALLLTGVWMYGGLFNGGGRSGEAALAENMPAHAAHLSDEQVSRMPAKASPRLLESGGKERALTRAESAPARPRALEGAVVESMERDGPTAAEMDGVAPLEWPSEPPAVAERLMALLERRQASFVRARRSMLLTRGANDSPFAPFSTVASPTDKVRLPQLNI